MSSVEQLFVTKIYRTEIAGAAGKRLLGDLETACFAVAWDDAAGQAWCKENAYPGYTSYSSVSDLPGRIPAFADLVKVLDSQVTKFAHEAEFDLTAGRLVLDSLWINILEPGGHHSAHIHPRSAVSGTFYVAVPARASAIKFEDPRHAMMMAAPPRKRRASRASQTFVSIVPKPGTLLLWESWLRHEVPYNLSDTERISISFNYAWN